MGRRPESEAVCQRTAPRCPHRGGVERETMATWRCSRLQQRIVGWLLADHQRTRGMIVSSHEDLVKALAADKGNLSHSLRTLEARGWLVIGRSPGGKAQHVTLTLEGTQSAVEMHQKL